MRRVAVVAFLCLLFACSEDGAGPPPPPPPPPAPPPPPPPIPGPAPDVSLVTAANAQARIAIQGGVLYWLDENVAPFQTLALTPGGAGPVGLFDTIPAPEAEISDGSYVYWVSGPYLFRTTLDGMTTILLDEGTGGGNTMLGATPALAMDATHIYRASGVPRPGVCGNYCKFDIRRVPKAGGPADVFPTTIDWSANIQAISVAGGHVFWVEGSVSGGSRIMKMPVGGGPMTIVVNGRLNGLIPPSDPEDWRPYGGMVADTDFVYFADANYPQRYRIMAAPTGGGAVQVLLADTTHPGDVVNALTHDATSLYWTDQNDVRSIPKSGGPVIDLAPGRADKPISIARVGTSLYWIEAGSIHTMLTSGGTPTIVLDSVATPVSLATDSTHLFWIEGGPTGQANGYAGIRSSALSGANVAALVESAGGGPFATDGNFLYFANRATVKKVATVAGAKPERIAIGDATVADIATDGVRVYWIEDGSTFRVRSVAVNGGAITTLASGPGPAGRMRLDADHVYWSAHGDRVYRAPKAGGFFLSLVGQVTALITDFDIDATSIYIAEQDNATISKAPIAGGARTPIINVQYVDPVRRIAASDGKVYWIDKSYVRSITADGDTLTSIHDGLVEVVPNEITFDNQSVYWTEVVQGAIRKATPK